jgi:MoCo/4Fe-4S cofactor protein with predicted Tat translocation signal
MMEAKGKEYWRSLDQLSQTDEFKEFLYREFPKGTVEQAENAWTRRSFLTTMGASLALAGLVSCRRPVEKIVPYVTRPENVDPGVPNYYATTMPLGLSAYGVIVRNYEGRPTFIEGNPLHPSSGGAVSAQIQASLLDLYDPDRSKAVLHKGSNSTWADFVKWWKEQHAKFKANGGEGLAVLSETFNSPTLARLKKQFEETFPRATWVAWEPISDENIYRGIEVASGGVLQPAYYFGRSRIVLSLDSDFLGSENESVRYTSDFSSARRVADQQDDMNRLYVVEPNLSVTGMMADHRVRSAGGEVRLFLGTLAGVLAGRGLNAGFSIDAGNKFDRRVIEALADDLTSHRGQSLILAGRRQPPVVHHMVMLLNQALGNLGTTVVYRLNPDVAPSDTPALFDLAGAMKSGRVDTLITIGGNPAYQAPDEADFGAAWSKVPNRVHLATHIDETSVSATWHVPRSHYLESWGDTMSTLPAVSVVQPNILPLHGSHSDTEFVALLVYGEEKSAHDLVNETWHQRFFNSNFENSWRRVLHDGVQQLPTLEEIVPTVKPFASVASVEPVDGIELSYIVTPIFDGRFANNGWLQEMPDAVTKLTWGNALLIEPKLAEQLGLEDEDIVELDVDGRKLEVPVWTSPGQADNTVSLALGYGRTAAGRVGNGVGVDAYKLRTSKNLWFASGVKFRKTGAKAELACTQDHGSMEGRPIVRENTLAGYKKKAEFFPEEIEHPPLVSMWDEHKYDEGYQWGMSIDLNACTGCNACVIACQSENNIPIVGHEQVRRAREMHWMRIDRYYAGDTNDPEVVVQPMNCQHCEMAPCEQVCPVAATSHDPEGLNVMVYNRCIGTRYCSNNCPYKVRRFNFFNYTKDFPELVKMVQNPEVTVRSRGVMEKCTYCIQRIAVGKINAKNEGRTVAYGEIKTACESACPAKAIVFGNIRDPKSQVARLKQNDRKYRVLEELNTRPRTTYMAKLRNPHPSLVGSDGGSEKGHNG